MMNLLKNILILLAVILAGCSNPVSYDIDDTLTEVDPIEEPEQDLRLGGFWAGTETYDGKEFMFGLTARLQSLNHFTISGGKVYNYFYYHTDMKSGKLYLEDMDTGELWEFDYTIEYHYQHSSDNVLYLTQVSNGLHSVWNCDPR